MNEFMQFFKEFNTPPSLKQIQQRFGGGRVYIPKLKTPDNLNQIFENTPDNLCMDKRFKMTKAELERQGVFISISTIRKVIINGKKRDVRDCR